jgi:hypothetical protein
MSAAFDRDALLDAFDRIGRAAAQAGTKLQIAVYGGSALMLASNFRFATELGRYFPLSAASPEKQQFLLKNMNRTGAADAPKYPR